MFETRSDQKGEILGRLSPRDTTMQRSLLLLSNLSIKQGSNYGEHTTWLNLNVRDLVVVRCGEWHRTDADARRRIPLSVIVRADIHRDRRGAREEREAEYRVGRVLGVARERRRAAGGSLGVKAVPYDDLVLLWI